jgi:DNA-binding PucR family transcriptional regulator
MCPRAPRGEEEALDTLVVVAPAAAPDGLHALHRLCVRALEAGRSRALHGVHGLADPALETALADQPLPAACLSERLLGGLGPADGFHRQLALTAPTFLDDRRRPDQTAAALFTHPDTVRHRLARLQQITGASLTEPPPANQSAPVHALRRWWALSTWLGTGR